MSIKNLTTENVKIDQNLNVNSINSLTYGASFTDFPAEDFVVGSVTSTTVSGFVRFNNVPVIAPDSTAQVNVEYDSLTPNLDCVIVTGVQLGNSQNEKLSCDIFEILNGSFTVSFTNFATTNFTGGSIAFNYLIIKGIS